MTPESPADEVLIIEEQVETEPELPSGSARPAGMRIAGIVVGSVGLGLVVMTIARRLASRRQGMRGRRRGARLRVRVQPRMAVFAPNLTIALPFSSIVGQPASGRARRFDMRLTRYRRPAGVRRGRGQRISGHSARALRFAPRFPGR
jgi:hypothetical protein